MRRLLLLALLAHGAALGAQDGASPVELRARAFRQGEVVLVEWPAQQPGGLVRAFGREAVPFPAGANRWRALLGIDLDQAPGEYDVVVTSAAGAVIATRRMTVEAGRFTTRTLKVDPNFVNPPKAVMPRIEREAKLMQEAFANSLPDRLWSGRLTRPVPHPANSRFGQRSVFNGEPRNAHTGTDFLSPAGTPIRAPQAGRIVVARDLYFSGGSIVIDHGQGLFSQFAHLSRIDATEGSVVAPGDVVGLVGATGRVTGAHLHWGMRLGGARVDPLSLMAVLDGVPSS